MTLQEINLEDLKVVIKPKDDIVFSFFFINLEETSPSLNEMLIILSEEIGKLIPEKNSDENLVKRIGETIFNWNF